MKKESLLCLIVVDIYVHTQEALVLWASESATVTVRLRDREHSSDQERGNRQL